MVRGLLTEYSAAWLYCRPNMQVHWVDKLANCGDGGRVAEETAPSF